MVRRKQTLEKRVHKACMKYAEKKIGSRKKDESIYIYAGKVAGIFAKCYVETLKKIKGDK